VSPSEAVRQFQAVLEARRRLRDLTGGSVSFDEELEAADVDVELAREAMARAVREAAR
jgi:hypothetical protein